jgi:hypothetical protein
MSRKLVCTECGGKMEAGIIVDGFQGSFFDASYWMEGTPKKNFWGSITREGKKKAYISALRCETCGFVKLYAGPDKSESN